MKATLVGFTIPDELLHEINRTDALMASQTHRFAWATVSALTSAGVDVNLVSAAPVSDYPRNPRLFWRSRSFVQHGVQGYLMPFVNAIILKHLTRSLSAWTLGLRRLRQGRPDWILVHGVHTPFLWFGVGAARLVGAKAGVLVTDPPGVVRPEDGLVRRTLKRLDIALSRAALMRSDAVVVLAKPLAEDFATGVPHMVMEGIFDASAWSPTASVDKEDDSPFVITYAGGLSAEYGVEDLVNAVLAMPDPTVELHLFGRGPLEEWIAEVASEDQRVRPSRVVDPSELAGIYAASDVLVQPRPVNQGFVPYSFPSKLIEYLASGTPVVTTRLPNIPEDYDAHVVWSEAGAEGLRTAIDHVRAKPVAERRAAGQAAARFLQASRSAAAQGQRLRRFLEQNA